MRKRDNKLISGARVLLHVLSYANISEMFGYPGGAIIPIYNELYDFDEINVFETSHEQGAVFAASSYAKVKNDVGVCLVTSGPGATNIVTGIYDAYMDSVPLVAICGNVNSNSLGTNAFQEVDILSITSSITKKQYQPMSVEEIVDVVFDAVCVANSGRKRPVIIDICKDVQLSMVSFEKIMNYIECKYEQFVKKRAFYDLVRKNHDEQIKVLKWLLELNDKVVVIVGNGVKMSKSASKINEWICNSGVLNASTLHGLDVVTESEYKLGMAGMHGSYAVNYALSNANLVLGLGVRFDDRLVGDKTKFAKDAKIVQIDIDKSQKNVNINVDLFIDTSIDEFALYLDELKINVDKCFVDDVMSQPTFISEYSDMHHYNEGNILRYISENLPSSYFSTDVGQHQMFSAQSLNLNKHKFLSSGGSGTMGVGIPSAIGSTIASKTSTYCVVGDGGFLMSGLELAPISFYKLPVQIFLVNNGNLGMVRQWQQQFNDSRFSGTITKDKNPDFSYIAKAFDINYEIVDNFEKLKSVISNLDVNVPNVVEIKIFDKNNVLPIIPPNGDFSKIIIK